MTNGDAIRAMSDEALALFLANEQYRIAGPIIERCGFGVTLLGLYAMRLAWVKRTFEEEDDT